ncbi:MULTISPECIES: siroheme synthase CysG [unclassified Ensifer]|uniref:siroheme synthase CysG n=1 Tax=unclassified Ensifer TaxID=2633371 RepID=UPI000812D580|nr:MULTISPECIES: siroheme synthase CysG [unclassified Ensifer]OCP03014.1 uroporphyrinogen-III C-methyltransferase [Ensifer sp. LC14]OCP08194.1 uroporphyrinogen-III C-methyltransferase [Ensifer sp. LC11]OCP08867.1 uroporphyrinogen-III C-methyltransferase [Ensifer sp. LC13]OCP32236.1 uroporphyrinogen-III C-methyltransferase [Ensifer sp. LC499]
MDVLQRPRNETPARMEPLAKLPVFWALEGKRVVVAGGTDAAMWKAELLAACGARVEIYAEEYGDGFEKLIARTPDHPAASLRCHRRRVAPTDFDGAALAVGDCEDAAEARSFFGAARAAGVPVNVIDKPEFCQYQFGSIVNRSPVVVAISTDGAAPILAQTIRRKIETLLPRSLKTWAALAQSLRDEVNRRLQSGSERRAFWERFSDRVFSTTDAPEEGVGGALLADAERLAEAPAVGRVTLVGAGPGDAELLTLKAVRALQAADVILFDDLVSGDVLELARREAKRMLVGKRGGRESCRQEDINAMMVKLAKAGKRVVRLKSGDPMVFGRAGEEIAHLDRENIPVDVIPGITAASAMASRLGLSLTHRDHAQSLRLVTGHSRHGGLPDDVDWARVADRRSTTVFYMGGRTAKLIAAKLMEQGLPPQTPAIIMSDVSRATERSWRGTLATLPVGITEIGYDNPVLISVGEALAAREVRAGFICDSHHAVARAS